MTNINQDHPRTYAVQYNRGAQIRPNVRRYRSDLDMLNAEISPYVWADELIDNDGSETIADGLTFEQARALLAKKRCRVDKSYDHGLPLYVVDSYYIAELVEDEWGEPSWELVEFAVYDGYSLDGSRWSEEEHKWIEDEDNSED